MIKNFKKLMILKKNCIRKHLALFFQLMKILPIMMKKKQTSTTHTHTNTIILFIEVMLPSFLKKWLFIQILFVLIFLNTLKIFKKFLRLLNIQMFTHIITSVIHILYNIKKQIVVVNVLQWTLRQRREITISK